MTGSLTGRVVVLFGAAGGIGRACATRLAGEGASLVLADVSADALTSVEQALAAPPLASVVCDVRDTAQVEAVFARLDAAGGRADVLVNSVGRPGRGLIDDVDDQTWDDVLSVNLSAVFKTCRAALPYLRRSPAATIINLASVAGLREQPGSVAYSAAKGGVVMLSRTLAADLAAEDIRVFAVCPTTVDTEMVRGVVEAGDDPVSARRAYEAQLPMRRMLTTDEVAVVVADLSGGDRRPYTPEPLVV